MEVLLLVKYPLIVYFSYHLENILYFVFIHVIFDKYIYVENFVWNTLTNVLFIYYYLTNVLFIYLFIIKYFFYIMYILISAKYRIINQCFIYRKRFIYALKFSIYAPKHLLKIFSFSFTFVVHMVYLKERT